MYRLILKTYILLLISFNTYATSYNNNGQTGLINIPSAELHDQQSIYFTFNRSEFIKLGTLTVTPFDWMEASYFYYRPDDLLWGSQKGLYLDKGFNVKFSYKPLSRRYPRIAIGLDDFAGTGQFSREYVVSTFDFNNYKVTTGIGWGKFVGDSSISNPFKFIDERVIYRKPESSNLGQYGNPSYDLWFRGDAIFFGGIEAKLNKLKNLSLKIETNPFDYLKYACCGEGTTSESLKLRKKESDFNFGLSYKLKNFGNVDLSYIKGNTWNISFSIGFSSKRPLRKKNKFTPVIQDKNFNQRKKENEFYLDLLNNLAKNDIYLQSANITNKNIDLTIDAEKLFNPIIYSSRAAYIAKEVLIANNLTASKINVSNLTRGALTNSITYRAIDLDLYDRYPNVLVKRYSKVSNPENKNFLDHEFQPKVIYPIFRNQILPDIRTHVGSPQRFMYLGFGIKIETEVQLNRNIVVNSSIGRAFNNNFNDKVSDPNSVLPHVRTEILDYLQQSSEDFYINNLGVEAIWSPYSDVWTKLSFGYLEQMYAGVAGEVLYKPFFSNLAVGIEINSVKKRFYDQKFKFLDYETVTSHLNFSYYEPSTNILAKLSIGKYLAGDKGFTLDISRRMPSGWQAGFFFSRTNVSAEDFGEGSFDKGFYFNVPLNIFTKDYSKDFNGFRLRTMTRDGGQKLELRNRLSDSFYGSTFDEISENWNDYLN